MRTAATRRQFASASTRGGGGGFGPTVVIRSIAWAGSASTTSAATPKNDFECLARLADALPARFMTWKEFDSLCGARGVRDSCAAAAALSACGVVVTSAGGVHGHAPQAILDATAALAPTAAPTSGADHTTPPTQWSPVANVHERATALRAEVALLRPAYEAQLAKCANARRRTWAGLFALSGVQLAVFSRLTYFDLDWDTMEPVAYFLGSGIGVLAFGYTLLKGVDFNNRDVDRAAIAAEFIVHPDVVKYFVAIEELERLERHIDTKTEWVRTASVVVPQHR